jgi:hypothetical protein
MRSSSKRARVRLDFRVNELEFQQGLIKPCEDDPIDFQIVIEHRFLGSFALHEDFVFELRGSDGAGAWKMVSFEELKIAFLEGSCNVGAKKTEDEYEKTMELLRSLSEASAVEQSEHLPRIPIEGDSSHIDRAKDALSRGMVRYKIIGGIGSRGHIWGHATFLVRSLLGARIHLRRAGFLQSSESKYVLIDSENGWKIRLLEERPKTYQHYQHDSNSGKEGREA